jgi:hypothetical protein
MEQTWEAITANLVDRFWWQLARRAEVRVARLLYRQQLVDGVYPEDAGALLDEFFHELRELKIADVLEDVRARASRVRWYALFRMSEYRTLLCLQQLECIDFSPLLVDR